MNIKRFILFILFWTNYSVFSQDYKCYSCETGFDGEYFEIFTLHDSVIVVDTVYVGAATLQEMSKNFKMSYDEFVHHFLEYVKNQDSSINKEEQIYISYLLANANKQIKDYRYVLNKYSVDFPNDSFIMKKKEMLPLPKNMLDSMSLDFMFVLEGKKNTDNFLYSSKEQIKILYEILSDMKDNPEIKKLNSKKNKRVGLNFYFPDFSFEEKRAMAQFMKSVSLVIDSINIPEIQNLPLYFTFDKSAKEDNMAYLIGLCDMVDNVFVTDITSTVMSFEAIDKNVAISKLDKIKNQFYFVRFHTGDFPKTNDKLSYENIELLMKADYPNTWEGYFAGIIGILLLLIIGTVCYFFITPFANFIHESYMYVFAGVILLITQIVLLFVFMIEEMNSKTKVFNLWEILLVLILLVFFIPLIKKGISNKKIP